MEELRGEHEQHSERADQVEVDLIFILKFY